MSESLTGPQSNFSQMPTHIAGESTETGSDTADIQQLPNTGGAPLLMAFGGLLTVAGAFGLRRRIK
jgi:LPXTG-motif cell wall-anchored protein